MRRGFTQIELLVVIGILAMLAAILFPVLAQSKAAAKRTECVSNVRQLSAAMLMYVEDQDGHFPVRIGGTDNENVDQWIDMIFPYVRAGRNGKTSPLSKCSEFVPAPGLADGYGRKKITGWGYGMNGHLHNAAPPIAITSVGEPTLIALIGDSTLGDFYARPRRRARTAFANSQILSPYELTCNAVGTRHGKGSADRPGNGGSTMSYLDGHVRFLTANAIMTELGIHPQAPRPGDPLFFEGTREDYCTDGPTLGP